MTFDPVKSDKILAKIYHLDKSEAYSPYNERFDFLGYESSNFIHVIGTPILFMKVYALLSLVYLFIHK